MLGDFGFSYIGLCYLLSLTIPNILWVKHQPIGYTAAKENKILLLFERIGQVSTTCIFLIFTNFNYHDQGSWNMLLYFSICLMVLYECWWIHYFKKPTLENFYSSFFGIIAPGATLPVLAFFLLGIYGKVGMALIAVSILGIGHIGIHLQHIKQFKQDKHS